MSAAPATPSNTCHYCGLPVKRPRRRGGDGDAGPRYCCHGCRIAESITGARGEEGFLRAAAARLGLAVFLTMNVVVFSMVLWTADVTVSPDQEPAAHTLMSLFRYLCLVLSIPVVGLLAGPLLESALDELRSGRAASDLLLLAGVIASLAFSAVHTFTGQGHVYFEVGCVILVLVTLGRWLEAQGKLRATAALDQLARLLPSAARVVGRGGPAWMPTDTVPVGALVSVLAGETIPRDGRVLRHHAAVNEQFLTGESMPVPKGPGDRVMAGALNLDGELEIEVDRPAREGALERILRATRDAANQRGHYEQLADRVAAVFLPAIIVLALVALVLHARAAGLERGIMIALSVVLIACPCALGLATPMAVWAALGAGARRRVLFRGGEALERLARCRAIRFDKTGTLTTGKANVTASYFSTTQRDLGAAVILLARALARRSIHPLATALVEHLGPGGDGSSDPELSQVHVLPGMGLEAKLPDHSIIRLGSPRYLEGQGAAWSDASLRADAARSMAQGDAIAALAVDTRILALFAFSEETRPEAPRVLRELAALGLDLEGLTGDHAARGAALARQLGIPVRSELLPDDKVDAVAKARSQHGPVCMVGDGINDAPALASSDAGIAMGLGTDLARSAADVCLLDGDLAQLPWSIDHARRAVRTIRVNLFWAFAYNIVGIGWAVTGRLNPILAALAMTASSLWVVGHSLRLASAPVAPPQEFQAAQPIRHLAEPVAMATSPA